MSDYNLTIFDLEEGKEYSALSGGMGWVVYRKGGGIYFKDGSDYGFHGKGEDSFREIKPKKKLYAHLVPCTNPDIYMMEWHSGIRAAVTCIRMPEFDREIES